MCGEAKYWKDKWTEAQKEIAALKNVLKDEFEWLDSRQVNQLVKEEKKGVKYGKRS